MATLLGSTAWRSVFQEPGKSAAPSDLLVDKRLRMQNGKHGELLEYDAEAQRWAVNEGGDGESCASQTVHVDREQEMMGEEMAR